jgi:hypothetical protein
MSPIVLDKPPFDALAGTVDSGVRIVRGREPILRMKELLVRLSERCGQLGAMDYLEYFLSRPQFATKIPCLILLSAKSGAPGEVEGAVLLYEYQAMGYGSRAFVTDFHAAHRAVVALPESRTRIAALACQGLIGSGALVALISFIDDTHDPEEIRRSLTGQRKAHGQWATTVRQMVGPLLLDDTAEATLAKMGKHTRRNLRYYRRRVEHELGSSFIVDPVLTKEEFLAINRVCTYPVADGLAAWRYDSLETIAGRLFGGVRAANGDWLSIIAGRTHHGITEIDWQMNRAGLPSYSLSTVMRAFLLEHEIAKGTRKIYFEGGTPHPIKHTLPRDNVVDLVVLRRSLPAFLLRRLAGVMPKSNYLVSMLADKTLQWHPW